MSPQAGLGGLGGQPAGEEEGPAALSRSAFGGREASHDDEQHVGTGHQVQGLGVLARVVADPADAGHEDHRGRTDASQHLRVVAGSRQRARRDEP
jgi:hypothetical protein